MSGTPKVLVGRDVSASPELTIQVDTENIVAVVDTNVLLDVFSCHDLVRQYERLGPVAALSSPDAIYRRARARESLLLAMYFHQTNATTYSLREGYRLMPMKVDPEAHDALETHYTKTFIHFVRDRLLTGWNPCMPLASEEDPKGNAADTALLTYAQTHRRPLITNEAFNRDGTRSDKMRRKAEAAGVRVFTPREFYAARIDEATEIRNFLEHFQQEAPRYVHEHPEPEIIQNTIAFLEGYFRHVLLGQTSGDSGPVRVTL